MNLNKYIRIKIAELSKKYNVSLIEITSAKEKKISKVYRIMLKPLNEEQEDIREDFSSKKQLVSWLICQK